MESWPYYSSVEGDDDLNCGNSTGMPTHRPCPLYNASLPADRDETGDTPLFQIRISNGNNARTTRNRDRSACYTYECRLTPRHLFVHSLLALALVPMAEQFIYKYLSMSDHTSWTRRRKLIAERTLYFSEPDSFNDPWDLELSKHPALRHNVRPEIRMFCLSGERRDDALMFAHYGDSHRGIRLAFAIDQDHPLGELSPLARGQFVTYTDDLAAISEPSRPSWSWPTSKPFRSVSSALRR